MKRFTLTLILILFVGVSHAASNNHIIEWSGLKWGMDVDTVKSIVGDLDEKGFMGNKYYKKQEGRIIDGKSFYITYNFKKNRLIYIIVGSNQHVIKLTYFDKFKEILIKSYGQPATYNKKTINKDWDIYVYLWNNIGLKLQYDNVPDKHSLDQISIIYMEKL